LIIFQLCVVSFDLSLFHRYILGIESPLVCDILPLADDHHGLMDVTIDQFQEHHKAQDQDKEDRCVEENLIDNYKF
jgi:hypothetical protein